MNILKTILILFSFTSLCFSQNDDPQAFAIQNMSGSNGTVATFGRLYLGPPIIGYSPIVEFDYSQHIGSANNAYNYNTKTFYCMINILSEPEYSFLESIYTNGGWNILPYAFLKSQYNFTSLASDQSSTEFNLFATFETIGDNETNQFSVGKISVDSEQIKVIDKIPGEFQSSTFNTNPSEMQFYVISRYQQQTFVNTYSVQGSLISRNQYTYNLNMQLQTTGLSSNMFYCPKDQKMYFTNNLINNGQSEDSSSEVAPGLFVVSPSTLSLNDTGLTDQSIYRSGTLSVTSMGCDLNNPVIYSISSTKLLNLYPFGYTLDTINLETNQITSGNFNLDILNFYIYQ
ncbi:hypothetical protein ACTA71_011519 [Dictyostelium dimigraforme]